MAANKWVMIGGLVAAAAVGGTVAVLLTRPASEAATSDADIRALRGELAALRAQVERKERPSTSGQAPSSAGAAEARSAGDRAAQAKQGRVDERHTQVGTPDDYPVPENTKGMDERFREERRDAAWASATERNVRSTISSLFADAAVDAVECRTSTCQLTFRSSSPMAGSRLLRAARKTLGAQGGTVAPGTAGSADDPRTGYVVHLELPRDSEDAD